MKAYLKAGRILIGNIHPRVECGRYRAKAVVGDAVRLVAEIRGSAADLVGTAQTSSQR